MATDLNHDLLDESGNALLDESGRTLLATFPVPAVVDDLSVVRTSDTQVDLSWSSVTNATNYIVYRTDSYGGTTTEITNTTMTSYSDTGLTGTTSYRYFVKAVNQNNADNMPTRKSDAGYSPGTNKTF